MTIFKLLNAKKDSPIPIVSWINNNQLCHYGLKEYRKEIERHIALLRKFKIEKGDHVAIIANTSLEWHLFDLAIMAIGGITIPLFPNISPIDLEDAFSLIEFKLIISDQNLALPTEVPFLDLNPKEEKNYIKELESIEESDLEDLSITTASLQPDMTSCILLTSGTTGAPKAMSFSHQKLFLMLMSIKKRMLGKVHPNSKSLCSLPLAHVLGRCDSLLHLILPTTTQFGRSLELFPKDLKLTLPNYFITIPPVLNRMAEQIYKSAKESGSFGHHLFDFFLRQSHHFLEDEDPGRYETAIFYKAQKFFRKALKGTGLDELRFIVVGGGKINQQDFSFFKAIGISIIQGYGLTETLGPLTTSDFNENDAESVGSPFDNVSLKIATDGEILIKSPYLFEGYINSGADEFDSEGYYFSGDIGELNSKGQLRITDRKKDIITPTYGRNISPQKIENLFQKSEFIEKIIVLGDDRPHLVALVSTHKSRLSRLIDEGLIDPQIRPEELTHNLEVREAIKNEIDAANQSLSEHEQIKNFHILPIRLDDQTDFLTPSLKVKRTLLYNKFRKEINAMYQET